MVRKYSGIAAIAVVACVAVGAAQATKTPPAPVAKTSAAPQAKEQTWAGKISDGSCGANKHTMGKSDAECVTACAKDNGYVFVGDKDKVYKIANQKFVDLPKHAGQKVELTGTVKDDTITITKIATPKIK